MSNDIEEPIVTPSTGPTSDSIETHPAYAQIGVSRITIGGKGMCLYGSDFEHSAALMITISHSELHRGLSRDWPFSRREIISLYMSEAQWATFVSSPNVGMGTQCTLYRTHDGPVPQIPHPPERSSQFKKELGDKLRGAREELEHIMELVKSSGLSAKKQEVILRALTHARMNIGSNIVFTEQQFAEHMETTTEHAKQEIHGYISSMIARAGLTALQQQAAPFALLTAAPDGGADSADSAVGEKE